jgi:hypothetical protein
MHLVGYIDAGSGSYILAAVASGAAGTWFFIRSKFASLRGRKPETTSEPETPGADQ